MSENILRPWRKRGLQIIVGGYFRNHHHNTTDSRDHHDTRDSREDYDTTDSKDELKPLATQIAGHGSQAGDKGMMTNSEGCILKPIQKPPRGHREIQFYQTISNNPADEDGKSFLEYTPKFLGTKTWTTEGGIEEEFLILENLTRWYSKPCIMDIKIGAKTYGPDASEAKKKKVDATYAGTKKPFGFSVLGMSVYQGKSLENMKVLDKEYGSQLQTEDVNEVLDIYLNVKENDSEAIKLIAESFVEQLKGILHLFQSQTRFHIFGSSLLFVYDSAALINYRDSKDKNVLRQAARVKMIDFAHVHPAQGDLDHNYIFGCENVVKLFSKFLQ